MNIVTRGIAGTLESSDIRIQVDPKEDGIEVFLDSTVMKQFGQNITRLIQNTLEELGVKGVTVTARDQGALDAVIKARLKTAVLRAADEKEIVWGSDHGLRRHVL